MREQIEKIFSPINNLTKEQRKIIYISLVVLVFLLCFLSFVYVPQSRRFAALKSELIRTDSQIAEISRLTAGKDLAEAVKGLRVELIAATNKLPAADEVVIRYLLEGARNLKIEVKNINPAGVKPLDSRIFGYNLSELPILMHIACDYRTLGEYLHTLRNDFPVLVRLKQLDIQGKGEGQMGLEVTLQLCAYLAAQKN